MENWVILLLGFLAFDLLVVAWLFFRRIFKGGFSEKEVFYIRSHWVRIIDMFSGNPKVSILDADKLLDYALSKRGYKGSLGEKLKHSKGLFSNLDGVWRAHKLRNRVAHELGDIDRGEAKSALAQFKKALNDLGAGL